MEKNYPIKIFKIFFSQNYWRKAIQNFSLTSWYGLLSLCWHFLILLIVVILSGVKFLANYNKCVIQIFCFLVQPDMGVSHNVKNPTLFLFFECWAVLEAVSHSYPSLFIYLIFCITIQFLTNVLTVLWLSVSVPNLILILLVNADLLLLCSKIGSPNGKTS